LNARVHSDGPLQAVVFDLDGLLIDSEPLWEQAAIEAFAAVGQHLTEDDCRETTGLRIEEVAAHWWARSPWDATQGDADSAAAAMVTDITARVEAAIRERGTAMPGALDTVELCRSRGLKLAVASSSDLRLVHAALARIGLADAFHAVHSAEHLPHAKPHPAVFLETAAALGVSPLHCLVLEDSVNGVIAAKAARMHCIAVPAAHQASDPRFALADLLLADLTQLHLSHLDV